MRSSNLLLLSSFCVSLLVACGDDGTSTTGGGGGQGGGTGGSSQGGGGSGQGGSGGGAICGGEAGIACGPTEFCDFENDQCGGNDATGICKPRPTGCPDNYAPTCGCDGTVHSNACDAQAAGADVNLLGGCTPPTGMYGCGAGFCTTNDVCTGTTNDTPGPYAFYGCSAPPAACAGGDTTCACAGDAAVTCGGTCTDVTGGVLVMCPGG
jgi:hypothetical protein